MMGRYKTSCSAAADLEELRRLIYQPEKDSPACGEAECFACREGKCCILTDSNFGDRPCPFRKTWDQVVREQKTGLEKLILNGRYDLIQKYRKVLADLGIFLMQDDDVQEMFKELDLFAEADMKNLLDEMEGDPWNE